VKEAVELWKGDLREKSLLVRGTRLREVPLPPFAQEVLWDWLPQRDFLASHQPLPYPHLLLKPAPGKARGKPLGLLEAKWSSRSSQASPVSSPRTSRGRT
jgi:integrase/recombinase XerD